MAVAERASAAIRRIFHLSAIGGDLGRLAVETIVGIGLSGHECAYVAHQSVGRPGMTRALVSVIGVWVWKAQSRIAPASVKRTPAAVVVLCSTTPVSVRPLRTAENSRQ